MTEETWLTWTDPQEFLRVLSLTSECSQAPIPHWLPSIAWALTSRKLRLFAVGCCRRLEPLGLDPRLLRAIDVVEFNMGAGTNVSRKRRNSVKRSVSDNWEWPNERDPAIICAVIGSSPVRVAAYTSWQCCRYRIPEGSDLVLEERIAQGRLLRDVLGNPFRPVAFSKEWRTPTAVALAGTMYESRDFDAMPILADALEEAGCDDQAILAHCRDPKGVHIRGCWVADLVLGKA